MNPCHPVNLSLGFALGSTGHTHELRIASLTVSYHAEHASRHVNRHRLLLSTKWWVVWIASSFVLCVLGTDCGGSSGAGHNQSSPSPAPTAVAVCKLVSSADVSGAFHQQFSAGRKASSDGEIDNECIFNRGGFGQNGLVAIEVVSGDKASRFYTSGQQKLAGFAPVQGVGDEALLETDGSAILAIKGHIAVFITALLSNETSADRGNGCVLLANLVFSKST